ncbi:MAG: hypothetical protein AAGB22_14485, partial [Bacteroidota bacterium]
FVPLLLLTGYAVLQWHKWEGPLRVFRWFILYESLSQVTATTLALCDISNLPLLYVYVPAGMILLTWFYQVQFSGFLHPRVMQVGLLIFLLYCIADLAWEEHVHQFNSNVATVQSILVIVLALAAYLLSLEKAASNVDDLATSGLNWIHSGLFIYHASNLIIFYFGALILAEAYPNPEGRLAWLPHSIFSTVMYLCFFTGLWSHRKRFDSPIP